MGAAAVFFGDGIFLLALDPILCVNAFDCCAFASSSDSDCFRS